MSAVRTILLLSTAASLTEAGIGVEHCGTNLTEELAFRADKLATSHRRLHLNTTVHCDLVTKAHEIAKKLWNGEAEQSDPQYCLYSRWLWDPFEAALMYTLDGAAAFSMPWDKITQTTKLHPYMGYGCAWVEGLQFPGTLYITVCLYRRNPNETRCFCN
ncbi:hypothetical protein Q1695_015882 [Nippostrongylus brasiliensis]|nr:hypothetical protein Q1695_015882 [Nippostrongylus brasiliensis]